MLTDYTTVLDALKARGLPAVFDSDHRGDYIVITLGGASQITIGDLDDDLPYPQHLQGWSAYYTNLGGDAQIEPFFQTSDTDAEQLADAIADHVRQRNRERLAAEMVELLNQRLVSEALGGRANLFGDGIASWGLVTADRDETLPRYLVISSYPQPKRGIHTAGERVTGWVITEKQPDADRLPVTVYAAPVDPDTGRVADQVCTWIRQQTGREIAGHPSRSRISTKTCWHPVAALVDDDTEPGATRCLDCDASFPPPAGTALPCGHCASVAAETGACIACSNTRKRALLRRPDGSGLPSDAALEILQDTLRDLDGTTNPGFAWYPDPRPLSRTSREDGKCYRLTLWLLTDHAARDAGMLS